MILIIFNPVSGKGNKDEYQSIIDACDRLNFSYTLLLTRDEFTISSYFEENKTAYSLVVIAGGDGTISQTIDAMMEFNAISPIIIYPCGSTNELAGTLNIKKSDLEISLQMKEQPRYIDLGVFNRTHCFVYSMTFGNFTHITYRTPQALKNKLGYAAYWIYSITSLYFTKIRNYTFKVSIDKCESEDEYLFGGVSNSYSLGNIIQLHQQVSLDDGMLEIFLIRKPTKLKEYRKIVKSLLIRNYDNEWFLIRSAKQFRFISEKPHSWNKDGEFAGKLKQVEIVVKPRYLEIY